MSLSMDDTEDSDLSIDEYMTEDDQHDLDKSEQENQLPLAKDEVSSAAKAKAIYIPGLANNGANSCFLNSTLQSLATIQGLLVHLHHVIAACEDSSSITTTKALHDMLLALNTSAPTRKVLRPISLTNSLARSSPSRRELLNSDQQDAQELLVMLLAAVEEEVQKLEESLFETQQAYSGESLGLRSIATDDSTPSKASTSALAETPRFRNPFQSLMAHRIACLTCGYTEAIRLLPSDQLTLNVPNMRTCSLETILAESTKLEVLDEFACRRCSLQLTKDRLQETIASAKESSASEKLTDSKKKRLKVVQKNSDRLTQLIESDVEGDVGEIKLDRVYRPASKQTVYAKPAEILAFHLSRSLSFVRGMPVRSSCFVTFSEYLDFDPFCTSPQLPTRPSTSMTYRQEGQGALQYRLSSAIVHYGSHNFGHYITYRRRTPQSSAWYRVSDEDVHLVDIQEVLRCNPILLFYERVRAGTSEDEAGQVAKGRIVSRQSSPANA